MRFRAKCIKWKWNVLFLFPPSLHRIDPGLPVLLSLIRPIHTYSITSAGDQYARRGIAEFTDQRVSVLLDTDVTLIVALWGQNPQSSAHRPSA